MSFLSHATRSALALTVALASANAQRVEITADAAVAKAPVTGRVFVFFSSTPDREPRLQGGSYGGSVPFFGLDVEQWRTNTPAVVDAKVLGFPFESLAQVPAGDYYAQAMFVPYTKFSPSRRARDLGAQRPVGGPALQHVAGQSRERGAAGPLGPEVPNGTRAQARTNAPAGRRSSRHALGEADQDQERAAVEVLGSADVHRSHGAPAQGLRRGDDAALSCRLHPGPLRPRSPLRIYRAERIRNRRSSATARLR